MSHSFSLVYLLPLTYLSSPSPPSLHHQVACGGDIAAKFDYNSGTYAYQAIPQKAEDVFTQITEVYVNAVRAEPQVS